MKRISNFYITIAFITMSCSIYASSPVKEQGKDICAKDKAALCDFAIEYAARMNKLLPGGPPGSNMILERVIAKDDTLEFYLTYDNHYVLRQLASRNFTMAELKQDMVKNAIKMECNPFGSMSSFIKSGGLVRNIAKSSTGETILNINVDNKLCSNSKDKL